MPSTINAQPGNATTFTSLIKTGAADANLSLQSSGVTAVTINQLQNANFVSTGAITLPKGTTAQRPASPVNGMWRYNISYAYIEVYVNNGWVNLTPILTPISNTSPVVAGSTTVGGVANVTNGTWNNSPTSYTYQWYANSTSITNATANTFTITSTQNGANLSCGVTAINTAGSTTANSNVVGPVTATYSASYLVIAGGGGGGGYLAGGGGAGGYLANSATLTAGTTYTVTIGAGGTGGAASGQGTNGSNSVFDSFATTVGGGGGGSGGSGGSNGGSGGGAGWGGSSVPGGTATSGQGNNGGRGSNANGLNTGGGGGAGSAGGDESGNSSGGGGSGLASSITGSSVTRAGGGGGGSYSGSSGGGGSGGGGASGGPGGNGTANTGSGGGGSNNPSNVPTQKGGDGGSGVVILSVPTSSYSGTTTGSPTITTSGSNTIIQFNSSGTYTA